MKSIFSFITDNWPAISALLLSVANSLHLRKKVDKGSV
jgi:hypothetical protein